MTTFAITLAGCLFGSPPAQADNSPPAHPLVPVVERILTGKAGRQPAWKLPMLLNGLCKEPLTAKCTTYCGECADGGGPRTRWGTRLRRGIVAADPRYWGPGSVVYIGPPVDEVLIVEDTGGAIRGPHRFDICVKGHHHLCELWGTFKARYVPLYRTAPRRNWGTKPIGWEPPTWPLTPSLLEVASRKVPHLRLLLGAFLAQQVSPGQAG